jgi:guanine deaminase
LVLRTASLAMVLIQQTEAQPQVGSTPKQDDIMCVPCKKLTNTEAEAFMQSAAASAMAGVRIGHGGPFGASIVRDGVIVACAHNMVLHCKDPSKHAEMNAIQQACQSIGSHDLSDCELYTTCEPCPMCWGAVQWSRLGKVYIGVDRHTAAKYGFDDKVFYDEIDNQAGCYGLRRTGFRRDTSEDPEQMTERVQKNMVQVYSGLLQPDVEGLFTDPGRNRTMRRRFGTGDGPRLAEAFREVFPEDDLALTPPTPLPGDAQQLERHESFMRLAMAIAERGSKKGLSKEREPFGAVVVREGIVLAECWNTVLETRDATATAEVNAIREAAEKLGTHSLEGCDLYCTSHPDLMSLGAILWARISHVYCGVSQHLAAQCGFEEGIQHFKDLLDHGGRQATPVVDGVAKAECEAVFREWSDRNGVIY